jgi:hypothetical protein
MKTKTVYEIIKNQYPDISFHEKLKLTNSQLEFYNEEKIPKEEIAIMELIEKLNISDRESMLIELAIAFPIAFNLLHRDLKLFKHQMGEKPSNNEILVIHKVKESLTNLGIPEVLLQELSESDYQFLVN